MTFVNPTFSLFASSGKLLLKTKMLTIIPGVHFLEAVDRNHLIRVSLSGVDHSVFLSSQSWYDIEEAQ